jgi:hypothetical protein
MTTQFRDNQIVRIARDSAKDYGLMLGREGSIKMKCMKAHDQEFYMVRVGRVPMIDEIKVAAADLDPVIR